MKNKKSGSTILMVLMVSTILIILSATISSSLVFTSVGNAVDKYKNDYIYAAEGGIELGGERLKNSGYFESFTIPFLSSNSENNDKEIYEVEVLLNKTDINPYILSRVIGKSNNVLAEIKLPIGYELSIANVLENTIYSSKDAILTPNAPLMSAGCNIAYNTEEEFQVVVNGTYNPPDTINAENNPLRPVFKNNVISKRETEVRIRSIHELWNNENEVKKIDVSSLQNATQKIDTGIAKFEIDSFPVKYESENIDNSHLGTGYKVILIDAPKLIIDIEDGISEHKYIIICSGEIEITSKNPLKPQAQMISCTLYGNGVYVTGTTNLTITGAPMYNIQTGNMQLREDQLRYLDEVLSRYMSSWGKSTHDGSTVGNELNYNKIQYSF